MNIPNQAWKSLPQAVKGYDAVLIAGMQVELYRSSRLCHAHSCSLCLHAIQIHMRLLQQPVCRANCDMCMLHW